MVCMGSSPHFKPGHPEIPVMPAGLCPVWVWGGLEVGTGKDVCHRKGSWAGEWAALQTCYGLPRTPCSLSLTYLLSTTCYVMPGVGAESTDWTMAEGTSGTRARRPSYPSCPISHFTFCQNSGFFCWVMSSE